jgi:hypothetical protein
VVHYISHQRQIYLLSRPLSSLARQVVVVEELFTAIAVMVKVYYIEYVVMIVTQHTQVVVLITSLGIYQRKIFTRARTMLIIHQLFVVLTGIRTQNIPFVLILEELFVHH